VKIIRNTFLLCLFSMSLIVVVHLSTNHHKEHAHNTFHHHSDWDFLHLLTHLLDKIPHFDIEKEQSEFLITKNQIPKAKTNFTISHNITLGFFVKKNKNTSYFFIFDTNKSENYNLPPRAPPLS
jgi:hypothetical protein